ncbi:phage tail protein [Gracilibacillus sp. HCP3S3_G5_1]|uniref:phage tail protein n=1 Tax=unclassified Gracilibacillus TaxID=2625209 RepID=UPI003F88A940
MYSGIEYQGKHSYKDFGITMTTDREIGIPSKNKILVQIPFSNQEYDFSDIYGNVTYTNRKLVYGFNVVDINHPHKKEFMNVKKTQLINWLMDGNGKHKLIDPFFPNYYFIAEVQSESSFEENWSTGVLTVEFEAYPFMVSELQEGHDIWDDFNFELDIAQQTSFDVDGELEVILYNTGKSNPSPKVVASTPMTIEKDNITYNISSGETQDNRFNLSTGENAIKIIGNGSISFEFYKELI